MHQTMAPAQGACSRPQQASTGSITARPRLLIPLWHHLLGLLCLDFCSGRHDLWVASRITSNLVVTRTSAAEVLPLTKPLC